MNNKKESFAAVARFFKVRRKKFALLLLIIIVGVIFNSITPYIYGTIIDNIAAKDLNALKMNLCIFLVISLLTMLLNISEDVAGKRVSTLIGNDIKKNIFSNILSMKVKKYDEMSVGELINRLDSDGDTIVSYYIDLITSSIMIIINLVISILFLVKISKQLTIISILFLPFSYLINFCFKNRVRILELTQRKMSDKYAKIVTEVFNMLKNIKIMQLEDRFKKRYDSILSENYELMNRSMFWHNIVKLLQETISNIFEVTIVFVSGILIINGSLTIGSMVSFNTYLEKLFSAVSKILSINLDKQSLLVSIERMQEIEESEKENYDERNDKDRLSIDSIRFEQLEFKYNDNYVLNKLDMNIDSSGFYSIIGENGAGKTTILGLISKLYEANEGNLIVGSHRIEDLPVNSVRNSISYMMKETLIINGTFLENLMLGCIDKVSEQDVTRVCTTIGLHHFIESEGGYHSLISEKGKTLSSGQKQKIGIARLILKKSPLILLDEITSDLDGSAELEIYHIIDNLAADSIVINVSHNKSLIERSKMIFVLNDGKVEAAGNITYLEQNSKTYRKLFCNISERG